MALNVQTYENSRSWRPGNNFGGTVLFKALGHPLAAEKAFALQQKLAGKRVAIYGPNAGDVEEFSTFYSLEDSHITGYYVQRVEDLETGFAGHKAQLISEIGQANFDLLLIASFDAFFFENHITHLLPKGSEVVTFDTFRVPDEMLTNAKDYCTPLNFTTNFVLIKHGPQQRTVMTSANYWSHYGAKAPRLWMCLFDQDGKRVGEWFEDLPYAGEQFTIDSADICKRFGLESFIGSLFVHATCIAGHDLMKYALDMFSEDGSQLSCSHDANPFPADLYAGIPAPDKGEKILLWIQNSHPISIPPSVIGFRRLGREDETAYYDQEIPPFGCVAIDLAEILPQASWPDQIEVEAGKYFVRPRYEVINDKNSYRIAHANIERTDLKSDLNIPQLEKHIGKGYIMPLPVLPGNDFSTIVMPTPMSTAQQNLPLKLTIYDAAGNLAKEKFLGCIDRKKSIAIDVEAFLEGAELEGGYGHAEFTYDFQDGGEADGWLHAIGRFQHKNSQHQAETIFGAHIYNIPVVYKNEPQSYAKQPPGLSTRLFLRLGNNAFDTICHLIYPASKPWKTFSDTALILHNRKGEAVAEKQIKIACGGSHFFSYQDVFSQAERQKAGENGYVIIRDTSCRLFGFHGLTHNSGSFCVDHMFGF